MEFDQVINIYRQLFKYVNKLFILRNKTTLIREAALSFYDVLLKHISLKECNYYFLKK